jgi:hypothetical protein
MCSSAMRRMIDDESLRLTLGYALVLARCVSRAAPVRASA